MIIAPTNQNAQRDTESALINVENLSFHYEDAGAATLHEVTLQVWPGEMVLLLGPSGAGKSTLALCLNGLIPQQIEGTISGQVTVGGLDTQTNRIAELCQQVGLVFQDAESQLALLTVADEVAFGPENLRLPATEVAQRVQEALSAVGLAGQEQRYNSTLSGGNKQRLATAAILSLRPAVLVFDEPTANLDPASAAHFFALCAELRAAGATILIIEHRLDELVEYVDRVAVMNRAGAIEFIAAPSQIFGQPATAAQLQAQGIWLPQVTALAAALAPYATQYPITIKQAASFIANLAATQGQCRPAIAPATDSPEPIVHNAMTQHSSAPAVLVQELSYRYPGSDGVQALHAVSLAVDAGQFFAIVGPNGSGKSTLAAHLVGLIKPPPGKVTVLGRDVAKLKGKEVTHLVGYVFQNPEHQFVARTVYDELAFGLRGLKMDEAEVKQRVKHALSDFGLEGLETRNPFALSQGQKRRLSVATMLLVGQQVLILDEPTFGQDEANAAALMQRLRQLQQQGITIVMITHDMRLVAEYADRVAVMQAGQVSYLGSPSQLFANSAIMQATSLLPPTLYTLSAQVQQLCPSFPLLSAQQQYLDYLPASRTVAAS